MESSGAVGHLRNIYGYGLWILELRESACLERVHHCEYTLLGSCKTQSKLRPAAEESSGPEGDPKALDPTVISEPSTLHPKPYAYQKPYGRQLHVFKVAYENLLRHVTSELWLKSPEAL